ncbi:hypothetical protein CYMTET_53120 [Cymbomonas tetramitiformis]|uniref:Pentatricopeptide repeat-containing protein n=1 Tax=Cymbomonas tetramitiformis TaxID=36881 RepID=A0AAE0BHJ7_9CHLO|nr:hypothetical protein CYMTET_53120 [Cymbomonas tetramitiformis]
MLCAAARSLQQAGGQLGRPLTTWTARRMPAVAHQWGTVHMAPHASLPLLSGGSSATTEAWPRLDRVVRLSHDDATGRGKGSEAQARSGVRRQAQRPILVRRAPGAAGVGNKWGTLADDLMKADAASLAPRLDAVLLKDWKSGDGLMALLKELRRRRAHADTCDSVFRWALRAPQVKVRISHYAILMSIMAKFMRLRRAFTLFDDMQKAGVKPDTVTYNTLITACAKSGKHEKAMGVLRFYAGAGWSGHYHV